MAKKLYPVPVLATNALMEMHDTFYGNIDPRRRVEVRDARMVQEDKNAIANLSPKFIHREFPKFNPSCWNPWTDAGI